MPRSPKGRAAARWLDARLRLQHAFMPAGDASLKTAQVNQKCRLTVITVSTAIPLSRLFRYFSMYSVRYFAQLCLCKGAA